MEQSLEAVQLPGVSLPLSDNSNGDVNDGPNESTSPSNSCRFEGDSVHSLTPPLSLAGTPSELDKDADDPSDTHLVSGSNNDAYSFENMLTHATWYEQECGEEVDSLSDEDESAHEADYLADGNIDADSAEDDNDLYNTK